MLPFVVSRFLFVSSRFLLVSLRFSLNLVIEVVLLTTFVFIPSIVALNELYFSFIMVFNSVTELSTLPSDAFICSFIKSTTFLPDDSITKSPTNLFVFNDHQDVRYLSISKSFIPLYWAMNGASTPLSKLA